MRTAELHRELRKAGLGDTEVFRSPALKRVIFQFEDSKVLKITYWANDKYITPALIVQTVLAHMAIEVSTTNRWVPNSATFHIMSGGHK